MVGNKHKLHYQLRIPIWIYLSNQFVYSIYKELKESHFTREAHLWINQSELYKSPLIPSLLIQLNPDTGEQPSG